MNLKKVYFWMRILKNFFLRWKFVFHSFSLSASFVAVVEIHSPTTDLNPLGFSQKILNLVWLFYRYHKLTCPKRNSFSSSQTQTCSFSQLWRPSKLGATLMLPSHMSPSPQSYLFYLIITTLILPPFHPHCASYISGPRSVHHPVKHHDLPVP